MAVNTLGHIDNFDVKNDNWNEYVEILEQYFYANDIDDEKKQIAC